MRGLVLAASLIVVLPLACAAFSSEQDDTTIDTGPDGGNGEPAEGGVSPADAAPADGGADVGPADASTLYFEAVKADAPIAWYRLGEKVGTTAKDQTGAHDGTYILCALNKPGAIAGDPDTAIELTAAGSSVRIPGGFALEGVKAFTLEAWVKHGPMYDLYEHIISEEKADAQNKRQGFALVVDQGTPMLERYVDDVPVAVVAASPLVDAKYHHVVGTYTGEALRLYVDGVLAAEGKTDQRVMPPNAIDARLGSFFEGFSTYRGVIDEAAVYDKALAADRVAAHFEAASAP